MKSHFKHETGYLNIDDSGVYFTISGNWQEAKALKERSSIAAAKHIPKKIIAFMILIALLILILIYAVMKVNKGGVAVFGLISLPILVYKVLSFFKEDMALKFYIPTSKIINYDFMRENTTLTIQFYDQNEKEDRVEVEGLEKEFNERIRELLKIKHKKRPE